MTSLIQIIGRAWPKGLGCLLWFLAVKLVTVCEGQAVGPFPLYGNYYLHDPGTMIKDGNKYFIYGDGQGISGIASTDLRNWGAVNPVFPGAPPAWTTNAVLGFSGYFWAPDIAYFNGRYNLYYACSYGARSIPPSASSLRLR